MLDVTTRAVKSILTEQKGGFLASPPYPFTHSLTPYTGCAFGKTACGTYCYAQFMPNWINYKQTETSWGDAVSVKINAAEVLDETLRKTPRRASLRIFMATTTDPYQPLEMKYRITRQCLDVFTRYTDLDLLVVQTRSPLASRDFDVLRRIPYVWLSVTIETDDQVALNRLGGGPSIQRRLELVRLAVDAGISAQITVSPCLPYSPAFADKLIETGAARIVVDNFVEGDGSGGRRTGNSPIARERWIDWSDVRPSEVLFERLKLLGANVSWSVAGFCGIRPRVPALL